MISSREADSETGTGAGVVTGAGARAEAGTEVGADVARAGAKTAFTISEILVSFSYLHAKLSVPGVRTKY